MRGSSRNSNNLLPYAKSQNCLKNGGDSISDLERIQLELLNLWLSFKDGQLVENHCDIISKVSISHANRLVNCNELLVISFRLFTSLIFFVQFLMEAIGSNKFEGNANYLFDCVASFLLCDHSTISTSRILIIKVATNRRVPREWHLNEL